MDQPANKEVHTWLDRNITVLTHNVIIVEVVAIVVKWIEYWLNCNASKEGYQDYDNDNSTITHDHSQWWSDVYCCSMQHISQSVALFGDYLLGKLRNPGIGLPSE